MIAAKQDLDSQDYDLICRWVYVHSGIHLSPQKRQLVRARLSKIIRRGNFRSFHDYVNYVAQDPTGARLGELLDALTTNTTHLFRESRHFTLLRRIIEHWSNDRDWRCQQSKLRVWSAGCSSGEEPHSVAMVAHDVLEQHPGIALEILATDLSKRMLSRATLAMYKPYRVGTVPPNLRRKYLKPVEQNDHIYLQLVPELRTSITLARFNLMTERFPFRDPFDVIFCRNVMMYFDDATRVTLVNKLAEQIVDGGYLMIGHSESLTGIRHPLSYVEPTVYQKR